MQPVEITLPSGDPSYQDAQVVVDGVNIASQINSLTIVARVGEPLRAQITMPLAILNAVRVESLELDSATAQVLQSLGWIPPLHADTAA